MRREPKGKATVTVFSESGAFAGGRRMNNRPLRIAATIV